MILEGAVNMTIKKLCFLFLCIWPLNVLASDIDAARDAFTNKDYTKSFNMFYPLALAGNPEAQDMAGMMLILGVGVDIDYAKGTLLLSLAESNGVEAAGDMRKTLVHQWKKQIMESLKKEGQSKQP